MTRVAWITCLLSGAVLAFGLGAVAALAWESRARIDAIERLLELPRR